MDFLDYCVSYLAYSAIGSIVFDFLHFVLILVLIRWIWSLGSKNFQKK